MWPREVYHHLRVIEAAFSKKLSSDEVILLATTRYNAGHAKERFKPFNNLRLSSPSGYALAKILVFGIPGM